ncbi:MAG: hypothetical protein ABH951_00025 [Patescibacteria group bacterium]
MKTKIISKILADTKEKLGVTISFLRTILRTDTMETPDPELDEKIKKLQTEIFLLAQEHGKKIREEKKLIQAERVTKIKELEILCLHKIWHAKNLDQIREAWDKTQTGSVSERICLLKWILIVQKKGTKEEEKEVSGYLFADPKLEEILDLGFTL